MISYGHSLVPKLGILLPKIAHLGCFGPKSYHKTTIASKFVYQNDCWVEVIKKEKRLENMEYLAPMVTNIVSEKNLLKYYCIKKHCPFKDIKFMKISFL